MANQYSGSLEHIVKTRFDMTAREFLEQCVEEQLSYLDAQKKLGVTHGTIRKWARRYNLELQSVVKEVESDRHLEMFMAEEINPLNFLSRRWSTIVTS